MCCASFHSSEISPEGSVLALFELGGQSREVVGYSKSAGIELVDRPTGDPENGIFIDRGFFSEDALESLVAEYVGHAEAIGCLPTSPEGLEVTVNWLMEACPVALAEG